MEKQVLITNTFIAVVKVLINNSNKMRARDLVLATARLVQVNEKFASQIIVAMADKGYLDTEMEQQEGQKALNRYFKLNKKACDKVREFNASLNK
jgi:hypothetical protein